MPVKSLKSKTIKTWLPPEHSANYRLTVERSDGTIDDITDIIYYCRIENGTTNGIGIFEFMIPNPNETYTGVWTGMEIFRFYCDYTSGVPTTLRFRGRLQKPSNRNNDIKVSGESEALFVKNQTVTKSYDNQDAGFILKDLFTIYGESRYDLSEIDILIGTNLTKEYTDVPFWDVVEELCNDSEYDCYIDANLIVKFFPKSSIANNYEAIMEDYNLLNVGDFAEDVDFVKNKIRVYGAVIGGVQIFYTANDHISQGLYGIRTTIINDNSITSYAQAKEVAESTLALKKDPPRIGTVTGFMLATIQPGELIRIGAPIYGIQPTTYDVTHYVHEFGPETTWGMSTNLTINKEPINISDVFKNRIKTESKAKLTSSNPEDLDNSYIFTFDEESGSHTNTEIIDGVLKKTTAGTNGVWQSPQLSSGGIINKIMIKSLGTNIPGTTYRISSDGGENFETISTNSPIIPSNAGTSIILEPTLVDDDSQIDSISIQWSVE